MWNGPKKRGSTVTPPMWVTRAKRRSEAPTGPGGRRRGTRDPAVRCPRRRKKESPPRTWRRRVPTASASVRPGAPRRPPARRKRRAAGRPASTRRRAGPTAPPPRELHRRRSPGIHRRGEPGSATRRHGLSLQQPSRLPTRWEEPRQVASGTDRPNVSIVTVSVLTSGRRIQTRSCSRNGLHRRRGATPMVTITRETGTGTVRVPAGSAGSAGSAGQEGSADPTDPAGPAGSAGPATRGNG